MKNLIANNWVDASSGETIDVFNPYSNRLIDKIPSSAYEDINECVKVSHEVKDLWAKTSIYERSLIIEKFSLAVKNRIDELANTLTRETGKPIKESYEELNRFLAVVPAYVEKARHMYSNFIPAGLEKEEEYTVQTTTRNPIGVVAVFIPSNSPVLTFAHKVPASLLMGNTVIIKPSSKAPLTITKLTYLLRNVGIPTGVVQIVQGLGSTTGQALASHPDIQLISFTGSTVAGMKVMQQASQNLTRVILELGGNDASIICEDADLELAVKEIIKGRMYNSGQEANSSKRVIVHAEIKEKFINLLLKEIALLKVGSPTHHETNISCLISLEAAEKVEAQVNKLVEEGARLLCGGQRVNTVYYPTVLSDIAPSMGIANNLELLGPVIPILSFTSLNNAVDLVNNSPYGLSAAIFTKDLKTAFKLASELEVGTVIINGRTTYRSNDMPFGGWKYSGFGTEGVASTLEQLSLVKVTVLKDVLK